MLDVTVYECGPSKPAGPRIGFNIAKCQLSSIRYTGLVQLLD